MDVSVGHPRDGCRVKGAKRSAAGWTRALWRLHLLSLLFAAAVTAVAVHSNPTSQLSILLVGLWVTVAVAATIRLYTERRGVRMTATDTPTPAFTVEAVNAALDAAVAKRGADYVYQEEFGGQCRNVRWKDGARVPGCIVGEVLHSSFGFPLEALEACGQFAASTVRDLLGISNSAKAVDLLVRAQVAQDEGMPWGRAVQQARGAMPSS